MVSVQQIAGNLARCGQDAGKKMAVKRCKAGAGEQQTGVLLPRLLLLMLLPMVALALCVGCLQFLTERAAWVGLVRAGGLRLLARLAARPRWR